VNLKASRSFLNGLAVDLSTYRAEIAKLRRWRDEGANWLQMAAEFLPWRTSLSADATPIRDERPWLTFGAIRHIKGLVSVGTSVFEYGAGGSTLFFLKRGASVVTVDHDARWIEEVAELIRQRGYRGWTSLLRPHVPAATAASAAPDDPDGYVSSGEEFRGRSFQAYAAAIDHFPDDSFDLVLVDGRARPSCGKHARGKVKRGGYLVVDNSERDTYAWIHADLASRGWRWRHFYGPGPYNRGFWQTSVYRRPQGAPG
jgi:hypothetical protein